MFSKQELGFRLTCSHTYANLMCLIASSSSRTHPCHSGLPYVMHPRTIFEIFSPELPRRTEDRPLSSQYDRSWKGMDEPYCIFLGAVAIADSQDSYSTGFVLWVMGRIFNIWPALGVPPYICLRFRTFGTSDHALTTHLLSFQIGGLKQSM